MIVLIEIDVIYFSICSKRDFRFRMKGFVSNSIFTDDRKQEHLIPTINTYNLIALFIY